MLHRGRGGHDNRSCNIIANIGSNINSDNYQYYNNTHRRYYSNCYKHDFNTRNHLSNNSSRNNHNIYFYLYLYKPFGAKDGYDV